MADISRLVSVSTRITSPGGTSQPGFGQLLLVGEEEFVPVSMVSDRIRRFSNLVSVGKGVNTTGDAYAAATVYFSQSPYPRPLSIAHWQRVADPGRLTSGEYDTTALGTLRGLTSLIIFGVTTTTAFAVGDSLSQIASKLETALQTNAAAGLATATVTADNNMLVIEFSGDVDGAYATGTTAGDWLMTAATGAVIRAAQSAETFEDMIADVIEVDSNWSMVAFTEESSSLSTIEDLSAWVQAQRDKMCAATFNLLTDAPPSNASGATQARYITFLRDQNRSRTVACHSPSHQYMGVSALALFAGVNYAAPGSHLTLANKTLPSISPDNSLTDGQLDQLDLDRGNYYTNYGSQPLFQRGVSADPIVYADERFFLDWFAITVRDEVLGLLSSSLSLPLDDFGLGVIRDVVVSVCDQGVANGGIRRGGTVDPAVREVIRQATGNVSFDGQLVSGYLVYVPPARDVSATLRAARQAPPIRVWMLGADSIQRVTFQVDFS